MVEYVSKHLSLIVSFVCCRELPQFHPLHDNVKETDDGDARLTRPSRHFPLSLAHPKPQEKAAACSAQQQEQLWMLAEDRLHVILPDCQSAGATPTASCSNERDLPHYPQDRPDERQKDGGCATTRQEVVE